MQSKTLTDLVGELALGDHGVAQLPALKLSPVSVAAFDRLLEMQHGSTKPSLRAHLLNQVLLI